MLTKTDSSDSPIQRRIDVILVLITIAIIVLIASSSANAASGSWSLNGAGVWSDSANWTGGTIADGAGFTGNFTLNNSNPVVITIDGAVASRTLGIINIGDTNGNNTYTITASGGGTLTFDNSASNAQLNQTSGSANNTISAPVRLNSSLDITNAAATATLTISGAITAGTVGTKTINAQSGNVTISGTIGDGSGVVGVTKSGTGILILSGTGDNTYSGTTAVTGGILELAKTSSPTVDAVSGNITIGNGATTAGLDILRLAGSGGNQIANTSILTFNGTGTNAGTFRLNGQSETIGGLVSTGGAGVVENGLSGTSTLTVDFNATDQTFSGILQNGAGGTLALVKSGTGTLTLTGTNTYTGLTTVTSTTGAGKLFINGNSSAATGLVDVNSGGTTLGGSGSTGGAVTVASGSNLSPGATGIGSTAIFSTGALTLQSGSFFNVDINNTTAGTGYDRVNVTGTVSIGGSNLVVTAGPGLTIGQEFFIVVNDNATPVLDVVSGTFAQGLTVTSGNYTFAINYADDFGGGAVGNDISLTVVAVPEPSTWIGAALALAAIGFMQRRRLRGLIGQRA